MEQSPSEANSRSASQEISRLLWNLYVDNRVHNNLPLVPSLSQMNPIHAFPPYFPKFLSNILSPHLYVSPYIKINVHQNSVLYSSITHAICLKCSVLLFDSSNFTNVTVAVVDDKSNKSFNYLLKGNNFCQKLNLIFWKQLKKPSLL